MSLIPRSLKRGFEASLTPIVDALIARNVTPNTITGIGTLVLVGAGVAYGSSAVRIGGLLLLVSGVLDMLDGRVARGRGETTAFGAFLDSTLDRIGESALLGGITVYFMRGGVPAAWEVPAVVVALIALSAALTVSYARARAEGLQLECKVGIAQRAERILGLGVPTLFFGAGPSGFLLLTLVAILAATGSITVWQRIAHVHRITRTAPRRRVTRTGRVTPELAQYPGKGPSGDG